MGKSPKLMNFSRMRSIFEPHLGELSDTLRFNSEIGLVRSSSNIFQLVINQNPPFAIDDHRLGVVLNGEARINFNLVERHVGRGTLVFLGPGSIISPVYFSPDFNIMGLVLFAHFPMPFTADQLPRAFNGQIRDFQINASPEQIMVVRNIFDAIWHLVGNATYNRPAVANLVAALMHHYDALYQEQASSIIASQPHEQTILNRFLYLVNRHAATEHHLGFYARKMCLTERYLGTVVRQASGVTAKQWLDRALEARIKVELRHSDKSLSQIAYEMNFSNPSFFSKYFKRLTGVSPAAFRNT